MAVLTAEWHDTLKHCDKTAINAAWANYRNTPPCHWPKPAEILALIRADQPRAEPPAYKPEPYVFAQDGRTIEEEVEHRKRVIADLRRKHGLPPSPHS